MKTKFFTTLVALFFCSLSYGQFSFGVSPSLGLTGAQIGYKVNTKFVPYISIQSFSSKVDYSSSGVQWDYDLNKPAAYSYDDELKLRVIIPSIGAKYFLKERNKLKSYVNVNVAKPVVTAKLVNDGEEDKDVAKAAENLKSLGAQLGFGVEYFFDQNFSVGGEFGLRHMSVDIEQEYESTYYNPNTGEDVATVNKDAVKGRVNPTYTNISFNFYF